MRKVEVSKYNPVWVQQFTEEAAVLAGIFGKEIIQIHHIGSTSVPGMSAKPIIDIMPVIRDLNQADSFNEKMEQAGYEAKGENGLPGRRYFQKGGDLRSHHVHMYEEGNPEIARHLAFRDYLRCRPDAARAYSERKEQLALLFPFDISGYIEGKASLVKEIEKKALQWHNVKRE